MFTYLTIREKRELDTMIGNLDTAYAKCTEKREFYMIYTMLNAFRDIVMTWPVNSFSEAYDALSDWSSKNLGVR